jgi:hypothetical protein
MERVSVARMATDKLQGRIYAARGMDASDSVSTELNSYTFQTVSTPDCQRQQQPCNNAEMLYNAPNL